VMRMAATASVAARIEPSTKDRGQLIPGMQ